MIVLFSDVKRQRLDASTNITINQFALMYIYISVPVAYLTILNQLVINTGTWYLHFVNRSPFDNLTKRQNILMK